jgi:hypothetical protein
MPSQRSHYGNGGQADYPRRDLYGLRCLPLRVSRTRERSSAHARASSSIASNNRLGQAVGLKTFLITMNPESELPELLEAEWARDQVLQLFVDLAAGAEVQHVQLRTRNEDRRVSLAEAELAFSNGTARAIQVRYCFEGEPWSDTILPGDPTTKIIRSRLPG